MTGYDRALRTLSFQEVDCTATWGGWIVNSDFFEYMTGKIFWENPRDVAFEAYRNLQVDMVLQSLYLPESERDWRTHTTETLDGHQKYRNIDSVLSYIESLPDPESLEGEFEFEKVMDAQREAYLSFQEELGPNIFCLPSFAACRFVWYMDFGYESYLSTLALYPAEMEKLFAFSAEEAYLTNCVRAELVRQKIIEPVFLAGQDICGSKGPIVSPELLGKLYFPYLKRSMEPLVQINADLIWHCDGYIIPILDALVETGMTGFQGFQESTGFDIQDIVTRKTRKGNRPILLAGLSITEVLPKGSVEDTKREVERIIDGVGGNGGVAIGTANTAGPDCRVENLETLYKYTHEYHPEILD